MNRKQSHQPISSYSHSIYQKSQYHPTSPYIELLQSKKNVHGYRYDTKNIRSFTNYIKPSQASISSIFSQKSKPSKIISNSNQKVKVVHATNEKKKRTKTQAQQKQKMHESLCIYPTISDKMNDDVNKSLYYGEPKIHTQGSQFQPNPYFQQLSSTGQKNKRKRHLSQNKHNHEQSSSSANNYNLASGANNSTAHHINNYISNSNMLDNLQINDIDSLIMLIDNCVSEANQYIAYLSEKMSTLKQELILSRTQVAQLQQQINKKDVLISQKDQIIKQLQKKCNQYSAFKDTRKQNGFQVKNLLQIIEKLSEENQRLRTQNQQYKTSFNSKYERPDMQKANQKDKQKQKQKQRDLKRDYYNQIHSKIDILNISIDNNHTFHQSPSVKQKQKMIERDTTKKYKQYKFIKPKAK